ncbi:MAG: hybrid sensor histidine kinase/response regulator, partial [Deltaproteobacteria bacterium]|nr:hybrid sensor histidine kinase/response regulator [Deltaproteobacteria bacterium]
MVQKTAARKTEKKSAPQQQISHAHKMEALSTLSNGMAHDFNNILSGIVGYSEVALVVAEKEMQLKNLIERILEVCDHARLLMDQVLSFSRKGWQAGDEEPVRMASVLEKIIRDIRVSLPANIKIKENIFDPGIVFASPSMLHKVIMNLCTNSIQAMNEKGGTLSIELQGVEFDRVAAMDEEVTPGPYMVLSVSDTGPGIPDNIREKIFDPYFTPKGRGEGTGLGLSVVHGVVKNSKSNVKVTSIPDKKTSFSIL